MMDAPPTDRRGPAASAWLARHALTLAVLVAMPLIFLAMRVIVGGLTPDNLCLLCPPPDGPAAVAPDLTGAARDRARVEAWQDYDRLRLPRVTAEPLRFEWERTPGEATDTRPVRDGLALLADDLAARYAYAVPTAILILLSVPLAIAAFLALPRRPGGWRLLQVAGIVAALAITINFQDSNPVRIFTAEYLLGRAALSPYPHIGPETWLLTFAFVEVATATGMAVTAALIVVFAWLATGTAPGDPPVGRDALRQRARIFKLALALGSAVLILAVAGTAGLFHWAAVLLAPVSRAAVDALASAATLYWGMIYSLTLLAVSAPAAIRLRIEIARAAQPPAGSPAPQAGPGESASALAAEIGFDFDLRRSLSTLLTLAAPLLTGPFLDVVRNLSGGG